MRSKIFIFSIVYICLAQVIQAQPRLSYRFNQSFFPLVNAGISAPIYIDTADAKVVEIAATAFAGDIYDITGCAALIYKSASSLVSYPVIIGTINHCRWIDEMISKKIISVDSIKGRWESFMIQVVDHPYKNVSKALVIVGSDRRGTAFGVFQLSKQAGVSPWKWWADAIPEKHKGIYVPPGKYIRGTPSVKYRGIFINDEDWGIQPWAAANMDTGVKDIGPHTYTKVFELLLRLQANYLWPAMHPCTKAFYYYQENPKLADDYGIVIGSSHCEPMLRNNVFEWAENFENEYGKKPGEWRYDKNQQEIYEYWKDRVDSSKKYESVYTVGMRGIHDGSMPGPKPIAEKAKLLQKIISDQRTLIASTFSIPVNDVTQIFCPYKEVLDVYRQGVVLPDDVTIVWADDNYGYVRQLSNEDEQKRSGRSGIYYHLSYWGSPHDYLWLSTTSPSLVSYEMTKAFDYGADRLWVFNVGDIKPAEMEIEFAMDLAWDIKKWQPGNAERYTEYWAMETFGAAYAKDIAKLKSLYYLLAAAGKPEHLGMVKFTKEEEEKRLFYSNKMILMASELKRKMPARLQNVFFETIYYPVMGAALMNQKFIYAHRSLDPAYRLNPLSWAQRSKKAFNKIQQLTRVYNDSIAGGKWKGIMSWHPRDLPVYFMPRVADTAYMDSINKRIVNYIARPEAKVERKNIEVNSFSFKKEIGQSHFVVLKGLGISGKALTLSTTKFSSFKNMADAPFVQYDLNLEPGKYSLSVKTLPTQSIDADKKLLLGVSVNGDSTRVLNFRAEPETAQWKENVLRGFAEVGSTFSTGNQKNTIRIYFPDPGVVISSVELTRIY
jgi:hypothetical protein